MLINDIVARADECRALTDAYEQRAVCVANTFRCKIAHKKAFFAVLTDERSPQPLQRRGARDDPRTTSRGPAWCATVRCSVTANAVDLLEYLRAHRDRFVIKPNDEYGGTGVTLGWEQSERPGTT